MSLKQVCFESPHSPLHEIRLLLKWHRLPASKACKIRTAISHPSWSAGDKETNVESTAEGAIEAASQEAEVLQRRKGRRLTRAEKGTYIGNTEFVQEVHDSLPLPIPTEAVCCNDAQCICCLVALPLHVFLQTGHIITHWASCIKV